MTPTFFITLMALFALVCIVGHWLYDGHRQDVERDRQARLDIAFKIAKQTKEKDNDR